jgi:glycine/serine hydroxymethyltransferase
MKEKEMKQIAKLIVDVLKGGKDINLEIKQKISKLCKKFPIN